MSKIAIIYTTFLRDALMDRTVHSIFENWHEDFTLLICYQGKPGQIVDLGPLPKDKPCRINYLPFDCGLSAARNHGVQWAQQNGYEYCLITADSIKFIPETIQKMHLAKSLLESLKPLGILGFNLKNRSPWEYRMEMGDGKFLLYPLPEFPKCEYRLAYPSKEFLNNKECDICKNFFLAKTQALMDVQWDDALKLSEHEDFFWRFKQSGWKVSYTPDISAEYIDDKPGEYCIYRFRAYKEFKKILDKKYNLNGWVEYMKEKHG
jgi:GT2 family glycosyltransferase